MGLLWDKLSDDVAGIFAATWTTTDGQVVPDPKDIRLGSNDAIRLDATILYADLAESTNLVDNYQPTFAAEIYKAYLHCAANSIRQMGGEIVSYDGDRIMAVYIGDSKNSNAAKSALRINGVVSALINPALIKQYGEGSYQLRQAVGIDTSPVLVARTGVRGDNDLVWVGRAANYAAKLCSYRSSGNASIITSDVYSRLNDEAKLDEKTGRSMWTLLSSSYNGITLYGSSWYTHNF
ncbi:guanylate cyclase [Capsulimonas corticalis]|uniref:Guanylate cyclase n=1 Tax=Capsulimonas corticalis TaxID=2219043 RepID=A0A402D659_9BACT|nr:adenylate/guanylate cyclase domain-containing protein [Capsulimonas corticalis]BDI31491.1 guanylate cyclase [Capsulimonas corticalis]